MTALTRSFIALALSGVLAACSSRVDVDKVPIGTTVEVTRQDGGVVRGTLSARDEQSLKVASGRAMRSIPRDQVASLERFDTATPPRLPAVAKFREYTLPAGTRLSARLETSLGSDSSRINDPVQAVLVSALLIDGIEVVPADSTINGVVTTAEPAGNVRGRASLAVHFNAITIAGRGDTYALSSGVRHTAEPTKGDDAKKIGIPAAGGALLGALLGGKKGALIGTAIGGGGGAVVVLTTSGPEVRYNRGTTLALSLDQAIDVRVPIQK